MNNTFDFKRFGQVLAKDWKDYFRNFGISLIVWSCIPVLFWIVSLIFGINIVNGTRISIIVCLVFSVLMFVPSKVYGNANLSREGVSFAILPATSSEKFFSMLIYCSILTPIIVGLGSWAVDTILTLLPFGGFNDYVVLPKRHLGMEIVTFGWEIMMLSSVFLFGNMVFKKRKAGKTIAWTILIVFVITMILQLFHFWSAFARWEAGLKTNSLIWINDGFLLILSVVFYYFTYRRIKNQKY